ncbi:hypothetical protein COBT_003370, partial [Conglomerata obtusa]
MQECDYPHTYRKVSIFLIVVVSIATCAIYIMYALFIYQTSHIYHPTIGHVPYDLLNRTNFKNQNSDIYIIDNKQNIDIIFFPFNGANLESYESIVEYLTKYLRCNIIIPLYRGFLTSKGKCNEINIMTDMHILKKVMLTRKNKVYVIGDYLGCAVGVYFASIFNVNGIVLSRPFYDLKRAAGMFFFGQIFSFLFAEKWETNERISFLTCKIVILVSEYDKFIDPKDCYDLNKLCKNGDLVFYKTYLQRMGKMVTKRKIITDYNLIYT